MGSPRWSHNGTGHKLFHENTATPASPQPTMKVRPTSTASPTAQASAAGINTPIAPDHSPPPRRRAPAARLKIAFGLPVALLVGFVLFATFALPGLIKLQAEHFLAKQAGHRLSLGQVRIDPFVLALKLDELRLATPDDQPLLSFEHLLIDLSAASLVRRAWVFDAIHLDGVRLTLIEPPEERLNWSALIEALQDPHSPPGYCPAAPTDPSSDRVGQPDRLRRPAWRNGQRNCHRPAGGQLA